VSGWKNNPPPPYPLHLSDHVWNLLVGHRELGIDARAQIHEDFGRNLSSAEWDRLQTEAERVQPFGGPRTSVPRLKLLALWYSDNTAPPALLQRSAVTVARAAEQTLRHDVTVSACAWEKIPGVSFTHLTRFSGARVRRHATIVAQIEEAVRAATANDETFDAVVFCEHDVLYAPNHFDRIGSALTANPDAPVASNLNYIGLSATGWQKVRERHEPLHQLALRWNVFEGNLARAKAEAVGGQSVILEPDHGGARADWVRIPPETGESQMPAVHVNHNAGRFTSHGDVCYEPRGYSLWHPHWGEAKSHWPGPMTTVDPAPANQFKGGCASCGADRHDTLAKWFEAACAQPSDFHEHVPTLHDLAAKCAHVTELSTWFKPADVALAHGLGTRAETLFVSVCRNQKPQWRALTRHLGERFTGTVAEPNTAEIDETDLLFVDTEHRADVLFPILERTHARVRKYITVHCTETFGESGDHPDTPGVLHALRTFGLRHPEWTVLRHDRNNHGLLVLSRLEEDRKAQPSLWRKAMNYTTAKARHLAAGRPIVSDTVLEERMSLCVLCPERALDACAACGCPLEAKLPLATETCGLVKKGLEPKWHPVTNPVDLKQAA
jgi:hypothetical protein